MLLGALVQAVGSQDIKRCYTLLCSLSINDGILVDVMTQLHVIRYFSYDDLVPVIKLNFSIFFVMRI